MPCFASAAVGSGRSRTDDSVISFNPDIECTTAARLHLRARRKLTGSPADIERDHRHTVGRNACRPAIVPGGIVTPAAPVRPHRVVMISPHFDHLVGAKRERRRALLRDFVIPATEELNHAEAMTER